MAYFGEEINNTAIDFEALKEKVLKDVEAARRRLKKPFQMSPMTIHNPYFFDEKIVTKEDFEKRMEFVSWHRDNIENRIFDPIHNPATPSGKG